MVVTIRIIGLEPTGKTIIRVDKVDLSNMEIISKVMYLLIGMSATGAECQVITKRIVRLIMILIMIRQAGRENQQIVDGGILC